MESSAIAESWMKQQPAWQWIVVEKITLSCVAVWRGLAWFGSEKPGGVNLSDDMRPSLVRELSSLHRVTAAIELPTCDCSCDVAGCRTIAMRQLLYIMSTSVHLVVFLVNCDFRASLRIGDHLRSA